MPPLLFDTWVALVALQRLAELVRSRQNLATFSPRARAATSTRTWIAMVVFHVAVLALPLVEVHLLERRAPPVLAWSCLAAFVGAQAVRAWCMRALGTTWNARAVVDPTRAIVASGPYRFVRHPNYAAVIVEVLCLPLGGGAWWSALVLNVLHPFVLAPRIRGEERLLEAVHDYRAVMGAKPRFVPRFT